MKNLVLVVLTLIVYPVFAGPGHLLLVGGGSEKINGWSDAPYSWAIGQSANKRVAIITYDTDPGSWLPNYFINLGAVEAKNFILNIAAIADLQETYDSLVTYDVIFFKGGDQSKYYEYYKNTLTQLAVEEIYHAGGVVGGTSAGLAILSTVFFSAENGTVYPEEALEDPFNQYMTLENDFMDLFPGYVFDSHFVERARFGRLLGFMGHWKISNEETLLGIGVDDKTAFCIDADSTGTAYGTGAVTFYSATENTDFRLSGEKLLGWDIVARQLLHECTIDLGTHEISGLDMAVTPTYDAISYQNEMWLSGSDKIYHNTEMLHQFNQAGTIGDTIILVTGTNTSTAGFFQDYLEDELNVPVLMLQAIEANVSDPLWTDRIQQIEKYLIVGNQYLAFMDFLHSWPNGNLLKDLVLEGEKIVAFVGDNSRFAGHTVLVNYEQEYASYDGLLEFDAGWGLLRNAIVMPKTFSGDIDNENAAAGVPYGMVLNNLKLGIWLHDDCCMHYWPDSDQAFITSFGDFPMILVSNDGTQGGFSTHSAVSSGEPRDVAGFEEFRISLMDSSTTRTLSLVESVTSQVASHVQVYPNPTNNRITLSGAPTGISSIRIFDVFGNLVHATEALLPASFSVDFLPKGLYLIELARQPEESDFLKLIIQ